MRRFLTLVCLLCLAIPAGISISGCTRNPAANYCNGLGYGLKITDVATITLQPQTTGISLAYGQTQQTSCAPGQDLPRRPRLPWRTFTYGTTNNQLVDISPSRQSFAPEHGTGTPAAESPITPYCNFPNPLPSTGGLP